MLLLFSNQPLFALSLPHVFCLRGKAPLFLSLGPGSTLKGEASFLGIALPGPFPPIGNCKAYLGLTVLRLDMNNPPACSPVQYPP